MLSILTEIELIGLLLLIIAGSIAGKNAAKLLYAPARSHMMRRIRGLLRWSGVLLALAVAIAAVNVWKALLVPPALWWDDLLLRVPLTLLTAFAVVSVSAPRLLRLHDELSQAHDDSALLEFQQKAARPRLVAPFRLTALGAFSALYFAFRPPVSFRIVEVALPLILFAAASVMLWQSQHRRFIIASVSDEIVFRRRRPALGRLGFLLAAAMAASATLIMAMTASHLPEKLNIAAVKIPIGKAESAATYPSRPEPSGTADPISRLAGNSLP